MYNSALRTASVLALACHATADVLRVDVGLNGLTFTPDTLTAQIGDIVEYHFHQPNHSVIEGDFANPCQPPASGGFFSGFMPLSGSSSEADNVFQVMINDTNPTFVYCGQNIGSHCKAGMSSVINPSDNETLSDYKGASKSVSSAGVPDTVFGGNVVAASMAQATVAPSPTPVSGGGGGGLYGGGGGGSTSDAGQIVAHVGFVAAFGLGLAAMVL